MNAMTDSRVQAALAVHGAGGGGWEWAIWQRVWRTQGVVLQAPDLQPAQAGLAATRLEDYLVQIETAAAALPRPVLLGASLGGLVALALAARVGARALILVNPVAPAGIAPRPVGRNSADGVLAWASRRRYAGTREALADADDAAVLFAYRRWRDESAGAVAAAAAGVATSPPDCPVLLIASDADTDVPFAASQALAAKLGADLWRCRGGSHVGPLLGRGAAALASRALAWSLSAIVDGAVTTLDAR